MPGTDGVEPCKGATELALLHGVEHAHVVDLEVVRQTRRVEGFYTTFQFFPSGTMLST
jgi:hypothetical protein